jgi:hypothetical protein
MHTKKISSGVKTISDSGHYPELGATIGYEHSKIDFYRRGYLLVTPETNTLLVDNKYADLFCINCY